MIPAPATSDRDLMASEAASWRSRQVTSSQIEAAAWQWREVQARSSSSVDVDAVAQPPASSSREISREMAPPHLAPPPSDGAHPQSGAHVQDKLTQAQRQVEVLRAQLLMLGVQPCI